MERPMIAWLYSITLLLGTALLLPTPRSTQALRDVGQEDLPTTEQDSAKESILGIGAVELPEGESSEEVEPGTKVFSCNDWAGRGPCQTQVGPEEDRDHLHHPQDGAREANGHGPPQTLSLEVQSGPEKDRDHLHHS